MESKYSFSTKDEMIQQLTAFASNPDDDCIRCKEIIKNSLLQCPELLYLFHETDLETQEQIKHYLCYRVMFDDSPNYNKIEKYLQITFYIFVNGEDAIEPKTGLCRHDLMASMLRDRFNWSNIFGTQCRFISDAENITDNYFLTHTLTFELTTLNSIVKTRQDSRVINNRIRK